MNDLNLRKGQKTSQKNSFLKLNPQKPKEGSSKYENNQYKLNPQKPKEGSSKYENTQYKLNPQKPKEGISKYENTQYNKYPKKNQIQKYDQNVIDALGDTIQSKTIYINQLANQNKEKDGIIKEKDDRIKEKDSIIKEKDSIIKEKDSIIKEKDSIIKEKDDRIKEKDGIIKEKDDRIKEKDDRIKEKDNIILEKDAIIKKIESMILEKDYIHLQNKKKIQNFQKNNEQKKISISQKDKMIQEWKKINILNQIQAKSKQLKSMINENMTESIESISLQDITLNQLEQKEIFYESKNPQIEQRHLKISACQSKDQIKNIQTQSKEIQTEVTKINQIASIQSENEIQDSKLNNITIKIFNLLTEQNSWLRKANKQLNIQISNIFNEQILKNQQYYSTILMLYKEMEEANIQNQKINFELNQVKFEIKLKEKQNQRLKWELNLTLQKDQKHKQLETQVTENIFQEQISFNSMNHNYVKSLIEPKNKQIESTEQSLYVMFQKNHSNRIQITKLKDNPNELTSNNGQLLKINKQIEHQNSYAENIERQSKEMKEYENLRHRVEKASWLQQKSRDLQTQEKQNQMNQGIYIHELQ